MRHLTLHPKTRVHVYAEPVRINAMMDKLSEIVAKEHKQKPRSGEVFLFVNKRRDYVKALFYGDRGFHVLAKRLDPGCRFEQFETGQVTAGAMMKLLTAVVDARRPKLKRAA